jgi:hypothetical protein
MSAWLFIALLIISLAIFVDTVYGPFHLFEKIMDWFFKVETAGDKFDQERLKQILKQEEAYVKDGLVICYTCHNHLGCGQCGNLGNLIKAQHLVDRGVKP